MIAQFLFSMNVFVSNVLIYCWALDLDILITILLWMQWRTLSGIIPSLELRLNLFFAVF